MQDFIRGTLEYQNWGWNAITIGFVLTVLFTLVEGWGALRQNQTIWSERSGEAVSVSWMCFMGLFFITFSVYGISSSSVAMIFNGLVLGSIHACIIVGLWRFKGFRTKEKVQLVVFVLMIPAMAILPWKQEMFILFSVGTLWALAMQPWEMFQLKSSGVVEIRMLISYTAATLVWIGYAYAISDYALFAIAITAQVLFIVTFALWVKYPSSVRV